MVPITSEHEWLPYLKQFDNWVPPSYKTIILSPHPDDETLGAGGLIADQVARGIDVTLIAVTDGENAYQDVDNLRATRKLEQELALKHLGIPADKIIRLQFVDSNVKASEAAVENFRLSLIHQQVHIIAPWEGDYHPDHEAVGRVAKKIAQKVNAYLTSYFFWTWHYATFDILNKLPLRTYPLSSTAYHAKQTALACYSSQLQHHSDRPILPKSLLSPTLRPFEVYLPTWM